MDPVYLSYFLEESTPIYGGQNGAFKIETTNSIYLGDTSNNLKFIFPNHIGTHIDFPHHFSNNGKKCSDYPASFWVFNKVEVLFCNIDEVENKIDGLRSDIELLILKTGFGEKRNEIEYWSAQPIIPAYFARLFKSKFPSLRVFGFDLISLTSKLDRIEGKKAHTQFLIDNNILILEDMNLEFLFTAPETIIISPLQVSEADGVPCTVIAFNKTNKRLS
jgi:kynurenine formamidase